MNHSSKIYVAGHTGLLGSSLIRILSSEGFNHLITRTHSELELTDRKQVDEFFVKEKPEIVFLAAGKVGGIIGNKTYPVDYLHTNIAIQDNVFEAARLNGIKALVFYGSSCTYPKICEQPMKEEYWLTGAIEETSAAYAAAKIAGVIGCRSYNQQFNGTKFICLIPNSIFGPNDNFDLENSHVLSSLIKKLHDAKTSNHDEVVLWGSGSPRREFIHSDDVARASIFMVKNNEKLENRHYNLGTGKDYSIKELAEIISDVVGFNGKITWDISKPDGTPRKLLDSSSILSLGWKPEVTFKHGLEETYKWFLQNK